MVSISGLISYNFPVGSTPFPRRNLHKLMKKQLFPPYFTSNAPHMWIIKYKIYTCSGLQAQKAYFRWHFRQNIWTMPIL